MVAKTGTSEALRCSAEAAGRALGAHAEGPAARASEPRAAPQELASTFDALAAARTALEERDFLIAAHGRSEAALAGHAAELAAGLAAAADDTRLLLDWCGGPPPRRRVTCRCRLRRVVRTEADRRPFWLLLYPIPTLTVCLEGPRGACGAGWPRRRRARARTRARSRSSRRPPSGACARWAQASRRRWTLPPRATAPWRRTWPRTPGALRRTWPACRRAASVPGGLTLPDVWVGLWRRRWPRTQAAP